MRQSVASKGATASLALDNEHGFPASTRGPRREREEADMLAAPAGMLDRRALVAARGEANAKLFSTSPNWRRGRARQDRTSRRQISP